MFIGEALPEHLGELRRCPLKSTFMYKTPARLFMASPQRGEHYQAPLLRGPFLSVFAWLIAYVTLGIARGALETLKTKVAKKRNALTGMNLKDQQFQLQFAQATTNIALEFYRLYRLDDASSEKDVEVNPNSRMAIREIS